ncbi:parallel beta helix pectate lyase-like protein [Chitinophaga polysaccharea]|uniref:Parallel beta helix pectate lyase-like protein n=1 Tax=Chitinophaga polysaccharea TaxID=1293035 RepID=A0A561PC92_9BACT|nr:right-handed parallel beta-helix repeat-containing protein [Chitinophaga polysaccharea]TWF35747.1 parallel beta helix pectate lyase-like protein [Chitinophaga polysaccharea]
MNRFSALIIVPTLLLSLTVASQQRISVDMPPNTFKDATVKVQEAIAACRNIPGAVLEFQPGRYDFYPDSAVKKEYFISNTSDEEEVPDKIKTIGLFFENFKGLTIEGHGASLVFHGKMISWLFDHCEDITLRNISVDMERPTMSEMTLKTITPQEVVAAIHPDSRFAIVNDHVEWYGEKWKSARFHVVIADTVKGIYTYSSWDPFYKSKAALIAPGLVRFTGNFATFKGAPGNILTVRDVIRDQVGAFMQHCRNVQLENINMRYMHGLGIVAQFCENLSYQRIQIIPQPGSGRTMASSADGMHFSGCKGHITITAAHFKGLHDDPVNVHGTHLQITEKISPRVLKLRFMHHQTYGFAAYFAGDSVMLVHSAALQGYGMAKVVNAKMLSPREMEVTLDRDVPAAARTGDCLENITWAPSVTISNSIFEGTNARGLLVTTRKKVVIADNTFYRTGMHAILIADDASSWYESGPVQDVTITGNTFEGVGYNQAPDNYVIAIAPENHELVRGYMVHRNIRITDNTFKLYDYPVLTARSTANLIFRNNRLTWMKDYLPAGAERAAFKLTACEKVTISNNESSLPFKPEVQLEQMSRKELHTDLTVK